MNLGKEKHRKRMAYGDGVNLTSLVHRYITREAFDGLACRSAITAAQWPRYQ